MDRKLRIDIRVLRWVLLVLYILLVVSFFGLAYTGNLTGILVDFNYYFKGKLFWTILIFILTLFSQSIFIFTVGTAELCKPLRKRRLILPVAIAAFLLAFITSGLLIALDELFYWGMFVYEIFVWIIMGVMWLIWGTIFFLMYKNFERLKILKQSVTILITGSLLQLLITIPAHMIARKRPGCFAGIGTFVGVIAGILVIFWSFGPGIIFLFLREQNKRRDNKDVFR